MLWVLLAMTVVQVYDNVTGKGLPPKKATPAAVASPTVAPDSLVARLADLQGCVAADPTNLKCNLDLADVYYQAHQWPQAQVNFERAVRIAPNNAAVLVKLAGTYIYQEKFAQAIPTLQKAVGVSPDAPEIHLLLGLSYSKVSPPHTDEALAEWRRVITLDPTSAWATQAQQYINEINK